MTILVGYNDSNVAKDAVKLAIAHAELNDTEVDIIKVMPQDASLKYEEITAAERAFEASIQELLSDVTPRYKTQMIVTHLSAGEALVEFAKRHECLEIIIGVRRRSKVGKLVFSSTAQHVILNATCPVVSIK